ncbi:Vam6/Vps39-like protein [Smittium culicis]|uniref:Vam6/Vps39-like protein n=1 Tax=Smittium culicis TaxID=133412 RepID=A0A1R1XV50_9FUNG|nr:Vam6/Vps39-like protein [Smittium culicis]
MLTDENQASKEFNRERVASFLSLFSLDLPIYYLQYVIKDYGDTNVIIHDKLITFMIQKSLKSHSPKVRNNDIQNIQKPIEKSPKENTASSSELLLFLRSSKVYTASKVLAALPTGLFFLERSTVLGRLGRYEQALNLLCENSCENSDFENFCLDNLEEGPLIFVKLIEILLNSLSSKKISHVEGLTNFDKHRLDLILMLIRKYSLYIPAKKVIPILPDDLVIDSSVFSFLRAQITNNSMKIGKSKVEISLSHHELNRLSNLLYDCEKNYIKIEKTNVCFVCHKKLAFDSSFIALPFHYYESAIKNKKKAKDQKNKQQHSKKTDPQNTTTKELSVSSDEYIIAKYCAPKKSKEQIKDEVLNLGLKLDEYTFTNLSSFDNILAAQRATLNDKEKISSHDNDNADLTQVECKIKVLGLKTSDSHPIYNRYIREYQLKTLGNLTSNIKLLHYSCWKRISES